jgi:hypothetical protein
MKEHVVDLETAKILKDKLPEGWESIFYWNSGVLCYRISDGTFMPVDGAKRILSLHYTVYPAPILSEILELLPRSLKTGERFFLESIYELYDIGYKNEFMTPLVAFRYDDLAATAAAKLYIWLVDEGYIKEERNK